MVKRALMLMFVLANTLVIELNSINFDETLAQTDNILVMFYQPNW